MAGMGPPPAARKRRANPDTFQDHQITVSAEATADAPALPDEDYYTPATRRWYRTWCESPQAAAFVATDWQRLHMLAPLVEQYFDTPSTKLLSEIRLNESLLGATHVDRMRARIKVEQSPKSTAATPARDELAERRRRLAADAG